MHRVRLCLLGALLLGCGPSQDDRQAATRQRAVERAGEDPAALCGVARDFAGTPEGERAASAVAAQLAAGAGQREPLYAARRLDSDFAAWLEATLGTQQNAPCTPLTVRASIAFVRTDDNAASSAQASVERAVEAALEVRDREVLAQSVAEALAPLTGALVPTSAAVRAGEDAPPGTVIEIQGTFEGSDFLELTATSVVHLRREGAAAVTIRLPDVVLPSEVVRSARGRRTTDAASLTLQQLLRRLSARVVDGLGLREVDSDLVEYERTHAIRPAPLRGTCGGSGLFPAEAMAHIDPGKRWLRIDDRVFDLRLDEGELIGRRQRFGGPCGTRIEEIVRLRPRADALAGRWVIGFEARDDCHRCTKVALLELSGAPPQR